MSDSASSSFELDARLHVTAQEQGRAREFPIGVPTVEGMTLTIGRSRSADLTIHDDYISNQHVKITFRRGEHWIEDLGSTHGSKLNGQPLTKPEALTTGDVVLLGRSQFEYRCTRRSLAEVGSIADYADEKAEDGQQPAGEPGVTAVTVADGTNQTLAQAKAQSAAKAAAEAEKARLAKAAAAPAAEAAKTPPPPASATPATAPRERTSLVTIIAAIGGVAAILALVCYLAWQIFFAGGT